MIFETAGKERVAERKHRLVKISNKGIHTKRVYDVICVLLATTEGSESVLEWRGPGKMDAYSSA